jgi:hypothetical protein
MRPKNEGAPAGFGPVEAQAAISQVDADSLAKTERARRVM